MCQIEGARRVLKNGISPPDEVLSVSFAEAGKRRLPNCIGVPIRRALRSVKTDHHEQHEWRLLRVELEGHPRRYPGKRGFDQLPGTSSEILSLMPHFGAGPWRRPSGM